MIVEKSMTEILIHGEELQKAAQRFRSVSKTTDGSIAELDETIHALETKWSGAAQQTFYKRYKDLHQALEGISLLMTNIANEMNLMADRMKEIDIKDN
jgi:WXG100 family type VII secretion target